MFAPVLVCRRLRAALLLALLPAATALAQTGVTIGATTAPDVSAALDIISTNKGVLLPRVADATALASPATGLLVFQTGGTAGFYYNAGTPAAPSWQQLATASGAAVTASNGLTKTGQNIALGGPLTGATDVGLAGQNLTFSGTGKVGIGTTAPSALLTVQTSADADQGLRITNGVADGGTLPSGNIVLQPLSGSTGASGFSAINFNGYYNGGEQRFNTNKNRWRLGVEQRGTSDEFFIGSYNGTVETPILRALSNGRVGLGTNSPGHPLTVQADASNRLLGFNDASGTDKYNFSRTAPSGSGATAVPGGLNLSESNVAGGRLYVQDGTGNVGIGTTNPTGALSISPFSNGAKVVLYDGGSTTTYHGFGVSNAQTNYHVPFAGNSHVFYAGGRNGDGTELLRIRGDGNVGVGTGSPTATLDVNGSTRLRSLTTAGVVTTDASGNLSSGSGSGSFVQNNQTATAQTGGFNVSGTGTVGGLLTGTGGAAITGATDINDSGTAATTIGTGGGDVTVGSVGGGTVTVLSSNLVLGPAGAGYVSVGSGPNKSVSLGAGPNSVVTIGHSTSTVKVANLAASRLVATDASGNLTTQAAPTIPTSADYVQNNQTTTAQTGGFNVSGTGTVGGLLTAKAGTTVVGATSINASGNGTTTIGGGSSALSLNAGSNGTTTIGGSSTTGVVNLNVGGFGSTNIGTGGNSGTVSIGGSANALNLNAGGGGPIVIGGSTGTLSLNAGGNSATTIGGGVGALNLNAGSNGTTTIGGGVGTVNLNTGGSGPTNIGTGNFGATITIGGGTGTVNLNAGSLNPTTIGGGGGTVSLNAGGAGTTAIGTGSTSGAVTIGRSGGTVKVANLAASQVVVTDASGNLSSSDGSGSFIQNQTTQQTGNFNVSGAGTVGGALTVNGGATISTTSGSTVNVGAGAASTVNIGPGMGSTVNVGASNGGITYLGAGANSGDINLGNATNVTTLSSNYNNIGTRDNSTTNIGTGASTTVAIGTGSSSATRIGTGNTSSTIIGVGTNSTVAIGTSTSTPITITGATTISGTSTTINGTSTTISSATTAINSTTTTVSGNTAIGGNSGSTTAIGTGSGSGAVTIGRSGGTVKVANLAASQVVVTDASGNLSSNTATGAFGTSFIQNQTAADQTGGFRVSGNGLVGGSVGIGSTAAPGQRLSVVSADNAAGTDIVKVTSLNGASGVSLGYFGLRASGTNANDDLTLDAKGTGDVLLRTGGGTGNVGIGTAAPQNLLDLGSGFGATPDAAAAKKLAVFNNATNSSFYGVGVSAGKLHLFADATSAEAPAFTLNSTGNVGIGTTGPSNLLDLGSGFGATPADAATKKLAVFNSTAGDNFYGAGVSANKLHLFAAAAATAAPAFTLDNNGYVGLGTTNPGTRLEVAGQVKITGGSPGAGKVLTSDASGLATWEAAGSSSGIQNQSAADQAASFRISGSGQVGGGLTVSGGAVLNGGSTIAGPVYLAGPITASGQTTLGGGTVNINTTGTASTNIGQFGGSGSVNLSGSSVSTGSPDLTLNAYFGARIYSPSITLGGSAPNTSSVNVGIGIAPGTSYTLDVNGNIRCIGAVVTTSDARLKQNIRPIGQALAAVLALRGVRYTFRQAEFRDKNLPGGEQIGVLAQEVEQIFPELVSTDAQGFKAVNYAQLTPVLIEALKEQQQQIEALQARAATAEADHADLQTVKAQLARLLGEAPAGAQARK